MPFTLEEVRSKRGSVLCQDSHDPSSKMAPATAKQLLKVAFFEECRQGRSAFVTRSEKDTPTGSLEGAPTDRPANVDLTHRTMSADIPCTPPTSTPSARPGALTKKRSSTVASPFGGRSFAAQRTKSFLMRSSATAARGTSPPSNVRLSMVAESGTTGTPAPPSAPASTLGT